MKKIFLLCAVALLAASCKPQPVPQVQSPAPAPDPYAGWSTYNNRTYGLQFRYPTTFAFESGGFGNLTDQIVSLSAQGGYEGTNYVGSIFTVRTGSVKTQGECLVNPDDKTALTKTVTVNGMTFYEGKQTGAGAGNLYESLVYRTYKESLCYEVLLTIHTTNVYNYPEEMHIQEVDKTKPRAELQKIFETLTFTSK